MHSVVVDLMRGATRSEANRGRPGPYQLRSSRGPRRSDLDEKIIQKILDIEREAAGIRSQAEQEAASRVESARQEAKTMVAQAREQAAREADALLAEARAWAESEQQRILGEAEQDMERLGTLAASNSESAARFVLEQVVSEE